MLYNNIKNDIAQFVTNWLVSTCKSDSIRIIRQNEVGVLSVIMSNDKTYVVYVLSRYDKVIGIGKTYKELTKTQPIRTYSEACDILVPMLGLLQVKV